MRALTVGGAMVDTIAIVEDGLIEQMSMSNAGKTFLLLEQGSKTEASCISTHCGGGAINAAASLARLGFEVATVAKLGNDARADVVRKALAAEGVSQRWLLATDAAPTGASAVISAHDRNAAIFTFRGSNTLLAKRDLIPASFDVDLVYVSTLSGASADVLGHIVGLAGRGKALVTVNPGIRQISTRFSDVRAMLSGISILALNRPEAEAFVRQALAELSGSENRTLRRVLAASVAQLQAPAVAGETRHDIARALIHGLLQLGAQRVLLTDGKHGAYTVSSEGVTFCPSILVPVVGTAGAGDAFVSTFSAYTAMGRGTREALIAASVNSSSVVQFADAQSGLLRTAAIETRLAAEGERLQFETWPIDAGPELSVLRGGKAQR